MRVALPNPGRPDACHGGAAVRWRLRKGAGIPSVHTSYSYGSRSSRFRLDAGFRLNAGRKVPVLYGQVWYQPAVVLLVVVLLWMEPKAVRRGAAGYSNNKAVACSWASFAGVVLRASPSCSGGGGEKKWGSAAPEVRLCWSRDTADSRRTISAANVCWPTPIAIRWLTKPVVKSGDSTSRWRPDEGLAAATCFSPEPSGVVPGAGEEGRCSRPQCSGGRDGSDCFLQIFFRVLFVIHRDYFVIVLSFEVPTVTCTCTAGY